MIKSMCVGGWQVSGERRGDFITLSQWSDLHEAVLFELSGERCKGSRVQRSGRRTFQAEEISSVKAPGQQRAWGLLEPNGGRCAWVVRQRGEAREAGLGLASHTLKNSLRWLWPSLKQPLKTYCSTAFYQKRGKLSHPVMHFPIMVMDISEQQSLSILDFTNSHLERVYTEDEPWDSGFAILPPKCHQMKQNSSS